MHYYDTRTNAEIEAELLRYHGLPANDAELTTLGVYSVIDEKPDHNVNLFRLEKNGDPIRIDNTFIQHWKAVPLPLSEAKANLKRYVAERRWQTETGGVTLPDGTHLPTDVEARTRFGTALSGCPADGTVSVKLDGEFHTLTHAEMTALVTAIATHVQVCFDHERDLHECIDAAETIADLEALDVTTGWRCVLEERLPVPRSAMRQYAAQS